MNDNMVNSKGLPVGIQIAALPYQEETILYVMSVL